ncbi:hypothetical protein HUJ04_009518 [Dendroctonus ponderosae]|nr:hypothetical protein HUJ04_009518 [Dendroctonus ponderosae]
MEDVMKFKVASKVMKHLIEEFASSNLFGKDNYEYYARVTGRVLRVQGEWICSFQYPPTKGMFPNEYMALERYLLALSQGEECQSRPALLEAGLQPQVSSSSLGMIAEHTLLESCTRLSISLEQNGLFQNNTSHSSSTSHSSKYSHNVCSGPKMTLEELKAVNTYAESTRSLSYLPQNVVDLKVHERQTERMKTRSQWFLGPSVDCESCGGSLDLPLNKADVSVLTNALLRRSSSGTIVGVAGLSLSAESIQKRPSAKRANSRDKRYVQRSASRRNNKENGSRSSSFKGRSERRGSSSRSNSFKVKYENISRSCSFKNKTELCSCPIETGTNGDDGTVSEDGETTSAFGSFSGFSTKPVSADFSFLKDVIKPHEATKTNGVGKAESTTKSEPSASFSQTLTGSIFGASTPSNRENLFGASTTASSNTSVPISSIGSKKSEKYCSKLKGLNESVSKWIAKKVEENPLISLQPIFKDYDRYLEDIEKEESEKPASTVAPALKANTADEQSAKKTSDDPLKQEQTTTIPTFKFGASSTAVSTTGPTFTFGSAANASGSTKSFSFGSTTTNLTSSISFGSSNPSTGFAFNPSAAGSGLGDRPKTETDKSKENDEDVEDEPPKVEFKAVVESDSVYSTRCKVFVKKGENFGDRGVGNLYLKPIEGSGKFQLVVRADTNLGNLLLNFILSESVPTKRLGKKDVMVVAIPTPDAQPPPTPVLLRVKTPEDADKLLEVLEEHKK